MRRSPNNAPSRAAREAAWWIVRQHAGLSERQAERFLAWSADPVNREAWQAAQGVWSDMNRAGALARQGILRVPQDTLTPQPWQHGRWRPRLAWAAAVICAVVLLIQGPQWVLALRADARTACGEIRTVRLRDGSTVTLDTRSAVAFDMQQGRRALRLLEGAAVFEVAPDPKRPFVVEASGGSTTALGTVFMVRRENGGARVTGIDHSVDVRYPADSKAARILQPGESIAYAQHAGLGVMEHAAPGADAWRRGLLMFENQPLGKVVETLSRYYNGRMLIVDPGLARFPVSGVFGTGDAAAAVTILEGTLGIRTLRPTPWLILIYR